MVTNRIMVSFDGDAQSTLGGLAGWIDGVQSGLIREALVFYATNSEVATTNAGSNPEAYHQMSSSGEHVLLGVDFLHTFLDYVEGDDDKPTPGFFDVIDRVTVFHVHEYRSRFESLVELLDWLLFCGFLMVCASEGGTFHVVFPTGSAKWFMSRFIVLSTEQSPFGIGVEEDVSKVPLAEVR